jgi:hypothetical protein
MANVIKPFYKVREVEYSTDFKFFKENQVAIVKRGALYSVISRLESYTFVETFKPQNDETLRTIHNKLLNGTYGKGICVE